MKSSTLLMTLLCSFLFSNQTVCLFKRIDPNELNKAEILLDSTFKQDAQKRFYIAGGIGIATCAIGLAYLFYRAHTAGIDKAPSLPPVTLENVHKRLSTLEEFKRKVMGENIQNSLVHWAKAMSYHLFWFLGPMLAVEAIKGRVLRINEYLNDLFYVPSLEWVIQHKARLGKLIEAYDIADIPTEILVDGYILAELVHSTEVCKAHANNPTLCPIAKVRLEEAWQAVIDALIVVVGYMHMKIDRLKAQSCETFPLLDRADRLTRYTNELSTQLERILETPSNYTTLPDMIKRFKSQLEKDLIMFRNLETNALCIPKHASIAK